jgi:hypothetical protein
VRRLLLTATIGSLALLAGCSDAPVDTPAGAASTPSATPSTPSTPSASPPVPPPPTPGQLPRGGRTLFPRHQLVSYVGFPGSPALGPLDRHLDARAARLERQAQPYAAGRVPLPVMELIVVVATGHPGPDRMYRSRIDDAQIDRYRAVARRHKMLLLLDVQPGRADPLTEVKRYEKWLSEPDVGLAFDPEWAVGPGQVPGRVYGRTSGAELDAMAAYLSGLVTAHGLPEKVFVFHQLSRRIVSNEPALKPHPGVVIVKSVDGIGHMANKITTWRKLTTTLPAGVHAGFKLFFDEDTRHGKLMTPAQVLALRPRPELVTYE